MIFVNPNLKGKKTAEFSKKDFPHLFNEDGAQTQKTYIYMLLNDIIIESTEDGETIQRKAENFIKSKIAFLEAEILTINQKIKELKAMI